jgi:hypothetical protein
VLLTAATGGPGTTHDILKRFDGFAEFWHHDRLRALDRRGRTAHAGFGTARHRHPAGPDQRRRVVRGAGLDLGPGSALYGTTWPRRLWFSGDELVAGGGAFLPRQVRRNDGSVKDVTGANLTYQVHPDHTELVDDVIDWYDGVAAGLERTVCLTDAEEFALKR